MNVLIVGGGPAGLSVAALLARASKANKVSVIERRKQMDSHGWGVTLRDHVLAFLGLDRLLQPCWMEGRLFLLRGALRVDHPNPPDVRLATIPRDDLVGALTRRCQENGVSFRYGADGGQLSDAQLAEYDVVVAADGANSRLRERWSEAFGVTTTLGKNAYAWLATDRPFRKLTILLSDRVVPLLGWAYQYAPGHSSFIVERRDLSFEHTDESPLVTREQCRLLERCYADELAGHMLLTGEGARWSRFPAVHCQRLQARNVVLVGDAAHTTHFSQGFGTMFAFDDASALCEALQSEANVGAALAAYERLQKPKIAEFQATAGASQLWSENLLAALALKDERQIQALIDARWPVNDVPPAPAPQSRLTQSIRPA